MTCAKAVKTLQKYHKSILVTEAATGNRTYSLSNKHVEALSTIVFMRGYIIVIKTILDTRLSIKPFVRNKTNVPEIVTTRCNVIAWTNEGN